MMRVRKPCADCKRVLDSSCFYPLSDGRLHSYCKACYSARRVAYYKHRKAGATRKYIRRAAQAGLNG